MDVDQFTEISILNTLIPVMQIESCDIDRIKLCFVAGILYQCSVLST